MAALLAIGWASDAIGAVVRDDVPEERLVRLGAEERYRPVGELYLAWHPEGGTTRLAGAGTLVDERSVVTAAHVAKQRTATPHLLRFRIGGREYRAKEIVVHPTWSDDPRHGGDLAIVRLEQPVADIPPARVARGPIRRGVEGVFVSVGKFGRGSTGASDGTEKKRAGTNRLDMSGGSVGLGADVVLADFDRPGDPAASAFGSRVPLELECCPAHLDSGGAVFVSDRRGDTLAAVISFVTANRGNPKIQSDYGDLCGVIDLSRHRDWLREQGVDLIP